MPVRLPVKVSQLMSPLVNVEKSLMILFHLLTSSGSALIDKTTVDTISNVGHV